MFPLKGKLLNVREATAPQVLKNEEIQVSKCLIIRTWYAAPRKMTQLPLRNTRRRDYICLYNEERATAERCRLWNHLGEIFPKVTLSVVVCMHFVFALDCTANL